MLAGKDKKEALRILGEIIETEEDDVFYKYNRW